MAKLNGNGGDDGSDGADAPLIDLNDADIKKLIARAKKRGYITYDQLNEALPQDQMSSDQLEDIMAALNEMGVNIVENEEAGEDGDEKEASEEDEAEVTEVDGDGTAAPALETKKKETVDRTDDPVRMYLREMGAVELLSREGEIAIAKRIEAGRDTMILGLCESPITFNAIIDWSTQLNEGTMQLREILDLDAMLSKDPAPESLSDDEDADDNGEISSKNAGPSFKEEEEPEEASADEDEDGEQGEVDADAEAGGDGGRPGPAVAWALLPLLTPARALSSGRMSLPLHAGAWPGALAGGDDSGSGGGGAVGALEVDVGCVGLPAGCVAVDCELARCGDGVRPDTAAHEHGRRRGERRIDQAPHEAVKHDVPGDDSPR